MLLTIRTHDLEALSERLTSVNKRLVKHGLAPATITGQQAEFKERPHNYWLGMQASRSTEHIVDLDPTDDLAQAREQIFSGLQGLVTDLIYVVALDVPTELLQVQGHLIRGRVQREEAGDIITRIGEHEVDLSQFRGQPFVCSHCHTKRPRKAIWIFEHEETGQLLTMGDVCADDYFGIPLQHLMEDACAISNLGDGEDEEWFRGGRGDVTIKGALMATFGASLIQFEGYKSRKAHEDGCTSAQATSLADWVISKGWHHVAASLESDWHKFTRAWWAKSAPRWEEFGRIVQDARAWWTAQEPREDYLANCKTAILSMDPKFNGLLTCAVWEYMKHIGLCGASQHTSWADAWMGQAKDKLKDLPVELCDIRAFDGDYGPQFFVTLRTDEGHCLVWKTSSDPNTSGEWKQGTHLLLSGTIKGHSQYKTTKQTRVTRCKLRLS